VRPQADPEHQRARAVRDFDRRATPEAVEQAWAAFRGVVEEIDRLLAERPTWLAQTEAWQATPQRRKTLFVRSQRGQGGRWLRRRGLRATIILLLRLQITEASPGKTHDNVAVADVLNRGGHFRPVGTGWAPWDGHSVGRCVAEQLWDEEIRSARVLGPLTTEELEELEEETP